MKERDRENLFRKEQSMLFKREYVVKSQDKEMDWDVNAVLKDYPEIASAVRDDADQKLLDSALTPYIYDRLRVFESGVTNSLCVISDTLTDLESCRIKDLEGKLDMQAYKAFNMFITLITINILLGFFVITMLM